MLWTLIVLLVVFWMLGLAFTVAGGLILVLLVGAAGLLVVNLSRGRRAIYAGRPSGRPAPTSDV